MLRVRLVHFRELSRVASGNSQTLQVSIASRTFRFIVTVYDVSCEFADRLRMCKHYKTDQCWRGQECTYAHSLEACPTHSLMFLSNIFSNQHKSS